MRKGIVIVISALLAITLLGSSLQTTSVNAQGPNNDFPVSVELTGVIKTITATALTLTDDTSVKINAHTSGVSADLKPGVTVTITAELDDEDFVATSIVLGIATETPEVTTQTSEATAVATTAAAGGKKDDSKGQGKGEDNGQGNGDDNGKGNNGKGSKGNGDDNENGKGNNAKGQDENNGKGNNGKGNNGNGDDNENGKGNNAKGQDENNGKGNNGKGQGKNDQKLAACLKNTRQPVALRLALVFNVSYTDILTWHCKGKGFGEISRAYLLAQKTKMSVDQIFAMRDAGKSWSDILKAAGLDPRDFAMGSIIKQAKDKKGNH